ncbi:MAG: redox-sensitive transcriptional activator SoxR [Pseudomonadota bacterium]
MRRSRPSDLSVGAFAARAGVPVSTVHYYESLGLIRGWRTSANHRRYDRAMLRRVAIVRAAQKLGLPLDQIGAALATLPQDRTPNAKDWARMSQSWRETLTDRIHQMTQLRDQLDHCIGCGCLSVDNCPLYNPKDRLADEGSGARLLDP